MGKKKKEINEETKEVLDHVNLGEIEGSPTYADDESLDEEKPSISARCFRFSIKRFNSDGEEVFTKEKALEVFETYKSIKKYAVYEHDQDRYNDPKSLAAYNASHPDSPKNLGDPKDVHIHGIGLLGNGSVPVEKIAKWFNIPPNLIQVKSPSAFLDCVAYGTHNSSKQQTLGKHLYPDDTIIANFDWKAELAIRDENKAKYGKINVTEVDKIKVALLQGATTLDEVREKYPLIYANNIDKFKTIAKDYNRRIPAPNLKINMYIGGIDGGVGKGLMGRAIARAIIDPQHEMDDADIYFPVTLESGFNGYDGQPVLLWEDFRPQELLAFFCRKNNKNLSVARGELFKFLDPHQSANSGMVDVKFDNIRLRNIINIFDCIMDPDEWLDGLAGEYTLQDGTVITGEEKQKSQIYRRFPVTFWILEDDFSFRINKGVLNGTREFDQWLGNERFRGSLYKLVDKLNGEQYIRMSDKMIAPAVTAINDLKNTLSVQKPTYTDDELEDMFGNYGTVIDENAEAKAIAERENAIAKKKEMLKRYNCDELEWDSYQAFLSRMRERYNAQIEEYKGKLEKIEGKKRKTIDDDIDIRHYSNSIHFSEKILRRLTQITYDDYRDPLTLRKKIYENI